MKPFTEECRYDYPLTPESVVVDIGAYHGDWGREIQRRYGCRVWIFEPNSAFVDEINLKGTNLNTFVVNAAVGAIAQTRTLIIKGDMTGFYADQGPETRVDVIPINHVMSMLPPRIDVMKINAEGSEYEIMDRLLAMKLPTRVNNFQIQFHDCVSHSILRMEYIMVALNRTHEQSFWDENSKWFGCQIR